MHADERFMMRCLQLAGLGRRSVAPNPMVGAVIVHEGQIIGEGYHAFYGGPHAEVNAVRSVEREELLAQSTIYVSLEPCSHFGKTPPCADLLIQHRFARVVIGTGDPNPAVNGKGIERLRAAGIQVETQVLYEQGRDLNKHFYTYHEKKRPYILLKWAQTPNGLIDNAHQKEGISWISAPETQPYVHELRSQYHAILVGKNTVLHDNPRLTVRLTEGMNPVRIVLDSQGEIGADCLVMNEESPTLVCTKQSEREVGNVKFLHCENMEISEILNRLYQEGIQSILVEGGGKTLQAFIDAQLWDEAKIIIGQHEFSHGTPAPALDYRIERTERIFGDTILSVVPV